MPTQYMMNNLLFTSADKGDFAEIKRLLTSPKLKIKADIHYFNDSLRNGKSLKVYINN